jgi:hypothetical protein
MKVSTTFIEKLAGVGLARRIRKSKNQNLTPPPNRPANGQNRPAATFGSEIGRVKSGQAAQAPLGPIMAV